jgi:hypothetical protein
MKSTLETNKNLLIRLLGVSKDHEYKRTKWKVSRILNANLKIPEA